MEDAEIGLMLAAALDAIHAGELDGHEWRSRLLDNGNNLALNNNGCERTFIEVWKMDAASETRLCDEMAAAYETPSLRCLRSLRHLMRLKSRHRRAGQRLRSLGRPRRLKRLKSNGDRLRDQQPLGGEPFLQRRDQRHLCR